MSRFRLGGGKAASILTFLCAVLAVMVGIFVIAAGVASYKSASVQRGWSRTLGSFDEMLLRWPSAEANPAALELERLTAPIGIDTATRSYENRVRPERGTKQRYGALRDEMTDYRNRLLEQDRRHLDLPPEPVAAFLEAHDAELDAIRRHLADGDTPRWEMHLERMAEAPIPNLLGHINLQKLLVTDALARLAAGDRDSALQDLEASWNMLLSIADSPILISQLIAVADARMIVGALRQVEDVPAVWLDRLSRHDFRKNLTAALKYEGWYWTQVGDLSVLNNLTGGLERVVASIAKPYVKFCLASVSDDYRRRVGNLDGVRAICDYDLSARQADLNVPIPRWNLIGGTVVPSLGGTLHRLARLELDLELTVKLIQLEQARRDHDGRWPRSADGIERSEACPRDRWLYQVSPEGGMMLAFDRDVSWVEVRGTRLPLRFTVRPDGILFRRSR